MLPCNSFILVTFTPTDGRDGDASKEEVGEERTSKESERERERDLGDRFKMEQSNGRTLT